MSASSRFNSRIRLHSHHLPNCSVSSPLPRTYRSWHQENELTLRRIHLPMPLQGLMTQDDSPIIDFYPDDFEIDMNGKKMVWQGVALLPFIDEKRLLKALKSKEPELTDDEKRRNRWGDNVMFIGDNNALYDPFCGLYTLKPATKVCHSNHRAWGWY